jgi:hypothetical protein
VVSEALETLITHLLAYRERLAKKVHLAAIRFRFVCMATHYTSPTKFLVEQHLALGMLPSPHSNGP